MNKQIKQTQEKINKTDKKLSNSDSLALSSEDQKDIISEMKFLAKTWLDDFEKNAFNGKTINEILGQ
jgi:hypothetical protein